MLLYNSSDARPRFPESHVRDGSEGVQLAAGLSQRQIKSGEEVILEYMF